MKFLVVMASLAMLAGCASTSDIESLQAQIDVLKPKINAVAEDAASAKASAEEAKVRAAAAEVAANKAANSAAQISEKLDRFFQKTQYK